MMMLIAGPAWADRDYDRAQQLRQAGEILPLETILEKLQSEFPGKVLEVELETEHDQVMYEIEILDNKGKVREVKVNAKTGELMQHKREH